MTKKTKLLLFGGCKHSEKATKKYKKYNSPCKSFPHQPAAVITRHLLNKVLVFCVGCISTVSNFWIMFPPQIIRSESFSFLLHLPSDQIQMKWSFLNSNSVPPISILQHVAPPLNNSREYGKSHPPLLCTLFWKVWHWGNIFFFLGNFCANRPRVFQKIRGLTVKVPVAENKL